MSCSGRVSFARAPSTWSLTISSAPPSRRSVSTRSLGDACRPFLVPEPLHHELEIRRLDADDAVAALDGSAARLADADLAGQHLLQHGVDEFRLDLDPIGVTDEAVVLGDRLDDRRAGGLYVEVLQAQVVAQNARDPALEGVELGKRILADGEEEVHPQVRAVDDRGEVGREGTSALLAAVVDEVLLGLVEDHVEVAVQDLLPHPKGVHERALLFGWPERRAERNRDRLRHGPPERGQGVAAPLVEDDDCEARLTTLGEVRLGEAAKVMRHAGPENGALPDPGLAVEDGEPGRHQVRLDQLALPLPTEEEEHVELRVLERRQPLVRRGGRAAHTSASTSIRPLSRERYSSRGMSKQSMPRWRQCSCSIASGAGPIAQER